MGKFIGGFSAFLNIHNALVVNIHAIEEAKQMSFSSLWFECADLC